MFPSRFPLLCILQVLGVVAAVMFALYLTANPLALFGLTFMWSPPGIVVGASGDDEPARGIGFTADHDQ